MVESPSSSGIPRRKLWVQVLAFILLVAVIVLKPKVEAWLAAQKQAPAGDSTADQSADSGDSQTGTDTGPWKRKPTVPDPEVAGNESTAQTDKLADDPAVDRPASTSRGSEASENNCSTTRVNGDSDSAKKTTRQPQAETERKTSKAEKNIRPPAVAPRPPAQKPEDTKSSVSHPGQLHEIRNNVFESTAGLIYLPGGAEGHRLRHLMEHAKDNPQKERHGVFDGNRDIILAVIDEAYLAAKKGGGDVRSELQNGRRVYTVNLRRRVGQAGGQEGLRKDYPECRFIRLVLENGTEVVTAYPARSF